LRFVNPSPTPSLMAKGRGYITNYQFIAPLLLELREGAGG